MKDKDFGYRPKPQADTYEYTVPPIELQVDRERDSVLLGLIDSMGRISQPGLEIERYMIANWRVGFLGSPGNGKTTIMLQSVAAAQRNALLHGIDFSPTIEQYDAHLPPPFGREGVMFNRELLWHFRRAQVFEVPAVGDTFFKDRGVSAVESLAEENVAGVEPPTLFAYIVNNRALQLDAGFLRDRIPTLDPDEVFEELENSNIFIHGIPRNREYAIRVQEMYAKMGQLRHMRDIQKEMLDRIARWRLDESVRAVENVGMPHFEIVDEQAPTVADPPIDHEIMERIYRKHKTDNFSQVAAMSKLTAKNIREEMIQEAVYANYRFRHEMRLSPSQFMILYNPYTERPINLDLSYLSSMTGD